jgi:hypothetical protein
MEGDVHPNSNQERRGRKAQVTRGLETTAESSPHKDQSISEGYPQLEE